MSMQWHNLLFMHWPLPPRVLRPLIPASLRLDTFDGAAWIGIVPFQMRGVTARFLPPIPGLSAFCELNVRTYVTIGGKPGVWFFSLDAANDLAVRAARLAFHLPYYDARMRCATEGRIVRYSSARVHRLAPSAHFAASYHPIGPPMFARPDTLEEWLTARYALYAANHHGKVWRGDIDHVPWPLQPAEAELEHNTMIAPLRITLPPVAPLLHFARRLDVVAWNLEMVRDSV